MKTKDELLKENSTLKRIITEMQCTKNNPLESYKIKQITLELLDVYFKALKEDYSKVA